MYKAGNVILFGDLEWIVLDVDEEEGVMFLLAEKFFSCDKKRRVEFPFSAKRLTNNFHKARGIQHQLKEVEKYLLEKQNNSFREELKLTEFNVEAADSTKCINYGVKKYLVGLLTWDQYVKYSQIIKEYHCSGEWWLATPADITDSENAICFVRDDAAGNEWVTYTDYLDVELFLRPTIMLRF